MKKELRLKSIKLREKGYSIQEMQKIINVSKSSISIWVRDVKLSEKAKLRLEKRYSKGQLASQNSIKEKTKIKNQIADLFGKDVLNKTKISKEVGMFICAMIWWCEGNKGTRNAVAFTNSDPELIEFFLFLFRKSFDLDEDKFRILMHLHNYHDENVQKSFWSKVTKIPKIQFYKSYLKPSNGRYKKENYQGCIKIVYNDVSIARKLQSVAKLLMARYK